MKKMYSPHREMSQPLEIKEDKKTIFAYSKQFNCPSTNLNVFFPFVKRKSSVFAPILWQSTKTEQCIRLLQFDAFLQADVGTGGADLDLRLLTAERPCMGVAVPQLQVLRRNHDLDRLLLAGLQRNALEATQTLRCVVVRELRIQLNDFLAVSAARILKVETEHIVLSVLARLQLAVLERRVAQTVTEREDRLALVVHVRTAVADVIVQKVRELQDVAHPRLRRTASRVVVAEQDVGKTRAQLLAALRQVDDTRYVLCRPVDREREAADQSNHRVVVRLPHDLDQVFRLQLRP